MKITTGIIPGAIKVLIYGPEGIGKSTLASQFPDPLFIDTEGSTRFMDVKRLPDPEIWDTIMAEIDYVIQNPDCCRTLVIDTADWAESLCIEKMLKESSLKSIEDYGYGKGYVMLGENFKTLLVKLDAVISKGINVVIIAHAQMRKFEQPGELGAYDRWELKLQKKTSPVLKEWADMVLFCNYRTYVVNVDGQGAAKGKNIAQGGERVIYTTHHNCWDAKNRFGLPDVLPLSYQSISNVISQASCGPAKEATARTACEPAQDEAIQASHEPITQSPDRANEPVAAAAAQADAKTIWDLFAEGEVGEWDIQMLASSKGWVDSPDIPLQDYPEELTRFLISKWEAVKKAVRQIRTSAEIPFEGRDE